MMPVDFSNLIAFSAPPGNPEDAVSRINTYGCNDEKGMYGLVLTLFQSLDQFIKAMKDCNFDVSKPRKKCWSPVATTYVIDRVIDNNKRVWKIYANFEGPKGVLRIVNVGLDPESEKLPVDLPA